MSSKLTVVRPMVVTDAMLVSSDVPETDYAAWSNATTYALGDRVILTSTHKVYESLQAGNLDKNPVTEPTWWIEVSATNRWKVFDLSVTTQTAQANSFTYTLRPGVAVTAFAALNVTNATSMRVRVVDPVYGTVYDKTATFVPLPTAPDWWQWFFGLKDVATISTFNDLPSFYEADIIVDFAGGTDLAVGVLLFGQARTIGLGVEVGARTGITDYSRKETNEFGDTVLVQRAYNKRAAFDMLLTKDEVDSVSYFLTAVRATPCLWVGSDQYESTIVYGYYKTFDITISYPTFSDCSLELEGLT